LTFHVAIFIGRRIDGHVGLGFVHLPYPFGEEHLARRPVGVQAPVLQQQQARHETRRQVEIVAHRQHRQSAIAVQAPEDLVDAEGMLQIEERGRLVQEQHPRLLRQRAGDEGPLPLAARQLEKVPVLEPAEVHVEQCCARHREVGGPLHAEQADVRRAPHQHDLQHAEIEQGRRLRQDDGDAPGAGARRKGDHRPPLQPDLAPLRRKQAGEKLQQRRLSRSVRTDEADEAARRDRHGKVLEQRCPGARMGVAHLDRLERRGRRDGRDAGGHDRLTQSRSSRAAGGRSRERAGRRGAP
jgi:hypothetical protein